MRSGWSVALVIASLTLRRLFRGRAVWISVLIAGLPIAFAAVMRGHGRVTQLEPDILAFETLVLAVLPAMFVGAAVGEDIEDRTTSYLWSRPVPRWAVIAGKLIALAPLSAAFVAGSWTIAVLAGTHAAPAALSIVGLAAGTLGVCLASTAIATLVPKHGMSLTIAYMLFFDIPVGAMPISLANLSITQHLRAIAGAGGTDHTASGGAIGLAVLGSAWLVLALWRIRRREA